MSVILDPTVYILESIVQFQISMHQKIIAERKVYVLIVSREESRVLPIFNKITYLQNKNAKIKNIICRKSS